MKTRKLFILIFPLLVIGVLIISATSSLAVSLSVVTPTDGTTLLVSRTAAGNPLNPPTFQLKADIYLDNTSRMVQTITQVTFSYPGSGISDRSYQPLAFSDGVGSPFSIPAYGSGRVPVYDGLGRDLPLPLPATVHMEITFDADPPLVLDYDLALRDNDVSLGAYFFPAKASDLPDGQYWIFRTRHVVDSGGGGGTLNPSTTSQRYALDLGVARWNGSGWTELAEGAPASLADRENSDYLIFETQLYAIADGTVVSCYRGEADHDPGGFDDVTWESGGGNSLVIQHGGEKVLYAHMKDDSIPWELCPSDGQNDNLNIPVGAGDPLGVVGNTGRSTNPHLHIHAVNAPPGGPDTQEGVPLQFVNIRALGDDDSPNNLGENPNLKPLHGKALHRQSLFLPNTCGLDDLPPAGAIEVARHGIPGECYQDVFNQIVSRGYRPTFVDGYNVGGDLFFNAVFRPSNGAWAARHGLTGAEFQDIFDDLTGKGYRLHQLDSYKNGGSARYAAIFDKRPGPAFAAFHGLDDAAYGLKFDELANAGFVAVNVSTVEVGGHLYWTGLFENVQVNGWTTYTVPAADYQDTFDDNVDAGRLPIYVHGFNAGGTPYLTGIWIDPVGGSWAAVHGRTGAEYQGEWNTNTGAGRLTRAVSGYDNGAGSARFAAVWRERLNTEITSTPPDITNQTSASFSFTANTPFARFECKLDGGEFADCSSPNLLTSLSEGYHTFHVRGVDREGVRDLTPATDMWFVDLTPPEVYFTAPGVNTKTVHGKLKDDPVETTTIVGWGDISAYAEDALSGISSVMFEVNGIPVPPADVTEEGNTWTFTFVPSMKGENPYLIEVTATDMAGNMASDSLAITGVKTNKPMN